MTPTAAEVAENNATPAPGGTAESWTQKLEDFITSVESRVTQAEGTLRALAPLVPVVETVVATAAPEVAVPLAAGVAGVSAVAGVVDDLIQSLNSHFGSKLASALPAPGTATKAANG